MDGALSVLTSTPRSCTANFIVGHGPQRAVNIELAPDSLRLIDAEGGIISHANHFNNPGMAGVSEPPNPRRHLSEFRQKRIEALLLEHQPLGVAQIQNILKDHENEPQSLCRHRDDSLSEFQHTITKTAIIMDLEEKRIWVTNGQPCKAEFEGFSFI
jgi:isopenicillin-N N-acyltransferase-like protein